MHGHGLAFIQLGLLAHRRETFNERFGEWLFVQKNSSLAAGWAVAVEELASTLGIEEVVLFFRLLEDFKNTWLEA